MESANIHEAKTNFSRLVDRAIAGESTVIAKAGKPVARLVPLEPATPPLPRRTGFLVGRIVVPSDFDRMFEHEIAATFSGER